MNEGYNRVEKALNFATEAHKGQARKYTGEPYITHPIAVAQLVEEVGGSYMAIAAALLHDTVEDTSVTNEDIQRNFGCYVAVWVENLTDVSKLEDGSRAVRKEMDRQHTFIALPPAKTIKLADLIHNSISIIEHAPGFAKIYMAEKRLLLEVLKEGNSTLYEKATKIVDDYFRKAKI